MASDSVVIEMATPDADGLGEAVGVLREWQSDAAPFQLHPGDLGWCRRFGAEAAAAAVRTWRRDGRILAVGLLDGPGLLRLTTAPNRQHQPRSPGCSWNGAASDCHSRSTPTASPSPSEIGRAHV